MKPRSMCLRSSALLIGVLMLVAWNSQVFATTMAPFSVQDLVSYSHLGGRFVVDDVLQVDECTVRYRLSEIELFVGEKRSAGTEPLDIDVISCIVGAPNFKVGQEYALFINLDNRVERILGLQWGSFKIIDDHVFTFDGKALELSSADAPVYGTPEKADYTKTRRPMSVDDLRSLVDGGIRVLRERGVEVPRQRRAVGGR